MNRRHFLKASAGAVASAFVVPELIVPEKKLWFLGGLPEPSLERDLQILTKRMRKDLEGAVFHGKVQVIGIAEPENKYHHLPSPRKGPYISYAYPVYLQDLEPGHVFRFVEGDSKPVWWMSGDSVITRMID